MGYMHRPANGVWIKMINSTHQTKHVKKILQNNICEPNFPPECLTSFLYHNTEVMIEKIFKDCAEYTVVFNKTYVFSPFFFPKNSLLFHLFLYNFQPYSSNMFETKRKFKLHS